MSNVFNDPNYVKLLEIFKTKEVPDFVKEASIADEQDLDKLPLTAYADPFNRRYPINSRSNTWLSREYFNMDKDQFSKEAAAAIEARINKAAELWGLDAPKSISQQEAAKPAYVVDAQHEGKTVISMPLYNKMQCKEAAEYLKSNRSKLTYEMRRSMAKSLLAAPEDLKQSLTKADEVFLEKTAGYGMATAEDVNELIGGRVTILKRTFPGYAEKLVVMAHEVGRMDHTPEVLHKVACMIDLIDRATDLHRAYDLNLPAPEDILFKLTKSALEYMKGEMVQLIDGSVIPKETLINNKAKIDEYFSNVVGEIPYSSEEEMIEVVKTLPKTDLDNLMQVINE